MLNVVAQQSGFLVRIWSKLPLPFPVHLCSFFAGLVAAVLVASVKLLL
jgi:hypothetical protein